ncbi:MAG: UDP-N-acetylmuramoyl-tripeptide--D-alanyl-D-alanine ligase [Nitriliruptoraceae bacterium]
MISMPIAELATVIAGRLQLPADGQSSVTAGPLGPVITEVTTDTRDLGDGGASTVFVALRGSTHDGHAFVPAAVDRNVAAVVVDHDGRASLDSPELLAATAVIEVDDTTVALQQLARHVRSVVGPHAIAVTGSVGKTTVKDLTAASLATKYQTHASAASFNNEFGVPLTLLGMTRGVQALVAEIGARHPGDIAAMADLVQPDVAIVTAVEAVHLELFGSIEAIAATKQELVDSLGPDGTAVLNVDNPLVASMAPAAPATIRVGLATDADVTAGSVKFDASGHACVQVRSPWGSTALRLPLPGRHQVINGLLAIAAAGRFEVPIDDAAAAIESATVSRWRGQIYHRGQRTVIDDAYNANPASMRAALDTLALIAHGRPTIAVLGEMAEIGPTAWSEHIALGEYCATRGVSTVVAVGSRALGIADGARAGGVDAVVACDDVECAVQWIEAQGSSAHVILVKGSRVAGLDAVVTQLIETDGDVMAQGPAA